MWPSKLLEHQSLARPYMNSTVNPTGIIQSTSRVWALTLESLQIHKPEKSLRVVITILHRITSTYLEPSRNPLGRDFNENTESRSLGPPLAAERWAAGASGALRRCRGGGQGHLALAPKCILHGPLTWTLLRCCCKLATI